MMKVNREVEFDLVDFKDDFYYRGYKIFASVVKIQVKRIAFSYYFTS